MKRWLLSIVVLLAAPVFAQTPQELADRIRADAERIVADAAALKLQLGPPVVHVPTPADAQATLDAAPVGAIVVLQPGADYPALRIRTNGVTVRPANYDVEASPPLDGSLPRVPTLVVEADYVTVVGLKVSSADVNDLVICAESAESVVFDNVWIEGQANPWGVKRGLTLNCAGATFRRGRIANVYKFGDESKGIGGWNGPGPYLIEDSYVEAASINFLFGGADPSTPDLVPSDITIRRNTFTKKLVWRDMRYYGSPCSPTSGCSLAAKNLGEFKNARRFHVYDNVFQTSWAQGQSAFGLVLSVRNQSGNCPWCTVADGLIENNIIKDVGTPFSFLGRDDTPGRVSVTMRNIVIRGNVMDGVNPDVWGGRGTAFEINRGPEMLMIEANTVVNSPNVRSMIQFVAGQFPLLGFVVRGGTYVEGDYGIVGDGSIANVAIGAPALAAYAPGALWENVSIQRSYVRTITWPAGTTLIP